MGGGGRSRKSLDYYLHQSIKAALAVAPGDHARSHRVVVDDFLQTFSTFFQELLRRQTSVVKRRSLNGGPGWRPSPEEPPTPGEFREIPHFQTPEGPGSGFLTEIISSFWQCWDRSRIPLTNSLLAPTYAFPASIIPLQSFTSWGDRRSET